MFFPHHRWIVLIHDTFADIPVGTNSMLCLLSQSMTARDACRILFRHRWRSGLFFIAVVVIGVVSVLLTPRKYQSESTFYMKPDFRVDPAATNDTQIVAFDPAREGEMRSIVALLESRVLFEKVVDQLGTDVVFENDLKTAPLDYALASVKGLFPKLGPKSATQEREQAIQTLMKSIRLGHLKKSHVITVTYTSRKAERAQAVLEAYTSAAMEQHLAANRNSSSFDFFESQEALLKAKVLEATQAVRDIKNKYGLVSIDSQRKLLEDHITNLDKEFLTTESSLAAAEDNIELLRAQLPFEMQHPSAGSALSVASIDTMRNQLYTLELRYRELASRSQPSHPHVAAIKEQLEEGILVFNQQQLVNALAQAAGLRSKLVALQQQAEATKRKLNDLNEQEVSIAEIERQAEEAKTSHLLVARKLEQARIDQQLESGNISNLRMTQAPTLMGKPLSRKGLIIVSLALVVGTLGAVAFAYVSEMLDESLATANDVETSLGVPVLASLTRTSSHRLSPS